jgi:type IV fimbrial biogenesis protein FimT
MQHNSQTPRFSKENKFPFICHFMPFIWCKYPLTIPSIGCNATIVRYKQKNAGFTLIELVVTLVVVGILATVAVPSIRNIIKDHRLSGYTNELLADMNYARSEALKRATPVTTCKTTNPQANSPACDTTASDPWTTGRIIFVDTNKNGAINSGEQILRLRLALEDNRSVIKGDNTASGGTANYITFLGDGTTSLGAQTTTPPIQERYMVLCDDRGAGEKRTVAISVTGRVRTLAKGSSLPSGTNPQSCP